MVIAAVIYKFFPYGGVQLDFRRIIEECHRRGHKVKVFATRWEGECPGFVELHLVTLTSHTNHGRMAEFARKVNAAPEFAGADLRFGAVRIPGLDAYFAGDTCYAAKVIDEKPFYYRFLPRCRTYMKLEASVFERGGKCRIMLIVPGQQPDFERFYHTEPDRFHLLPPGIPEDRRRPDKADEIRLAKRRELGVSDDEVMIIEVGSGFATKGVDRAIRAVASLPAAWKQRARFFVAGRDNPRKFQALARRLRVSDRVTFLGGRGDVPALLQAADLMLHPAVNDAAAAVLAEAIVAGLPVLCTAACGFSALIAQARSGVVVPQPFEQAELDRQLFRMLETPAQLQAYQDNAILYADTADFYGREKEAVNLLESFGCGKAGK